MTAVKEKEFVAETQATQLSFIDIKKYAVDISDKDFAEFEEGIALLEQARELRIKFEAASQKITDKLLEMFNKEQIEEFYYKDKVVKPGSTVSYDCSKLETLLPVEAKQKITTYLPLKLNRMIIEQAINDQILSAKNFEEFIHSGLVERNVRTFIKFCDPKLEEERLRKLDRLS